ncbi:MAG: transposase [Desemzia incerta]
MAKYNVAFKLQVVQEYLEDPLGYNLLIKKYTLSSTAILRLWVRAYREFGLESLKKKDNKSTHSVQFKMYVLHFMKQTGSSYSVTAITFLITNTYSYVFIMLF